MLMSLQLVVGWYIYLPTLYSEISIVLPPISTSSSLSFVGIKIWILKVNAQKWGKKVMPILLGLDYLIQDHCFWLHLPTIYLSYYL